MSIAPRGPSGSARPPPSHLGTLTLPLSRLSAGTTFTRIHLSTRHPVFFSPGAGRGPIGRFDSARGAFGVLYASSSFEAALVETILRVLGRTLIGMAEITSRAMSVLAADRAVALVDLRGEGLQQLGLDASIYAGPYEPCGQWSDALYDHPSRPDGILYPSRHDPAQTCIALFQREDLAVAIAHEGVPLGELLHEVGVALRRYGKSVDVS